jgi:hypothetical protein
MQLGGLHRVPYIEFYGKPLLALWIVVMLVADHRAEPACAEGEITT